MIEIQHITKRFGRRVVLENVSFTAKKGEITCLIGVNGAGKTTILNMIMGLTPVTRGRILINGVTINKNSYEQMTYIPDAMIMLPHMRIFEAMEFMNDFYNCWNEKRAREILKFFKLNTNDRISSLSKGNTAKVNLLLGLAMDVDFILMDEPFSGIDIFSREQIVNIFTSHLIEGRGVVITTHEIHDIEHLIDQAIIIDQGHVVRSFYTEEVREQEGKSVIDVMREVFNE